MFTRLLLLLNCYLFFLVLPQVARAQTDSQISREMESMIYETLSMPPEDTREVTSSVQSPEADLQSLEDLENSLLKINVESLDEAATAEDTLEGPESGFCGEDKCREFTAEMEIPSSLWLMSSKEFSRLWEEFKSKAFALRAELNAWKSSVRCRGDCKLEWLRGPQFDWSIEPISESGDQCTNSGGAGNGLDRPTGRVCGPCVEGCSLEWEAFADAMRRRLAELVAERQERCPDCAVEVGGSDDLSRSPIHVEYCVQGKINPCKLCAHVSASTKCTDKPRTDRYRLKITLRQCYKCWPTQVACCVPFFELKDCPSPPPGSDDPPRPPVFHTNGMMAEMRPRQKVLSNTCNVKVCIRPREGGGDAGYIRVGLNEPCPLGTRPETLYGQAHPNLVACGGAPVTIPPGSVGEGSCPASIMTLVTPPPPECPAGHCCLKSYTEFPLLDPFNPNEIAMKCPQIDDYKICGAN